MLRTGISADFNAALQDLRERTLADLPGGVTKLVYLSSTRDYNTGEYQHAGLADRFGGDTAQKALARCHELTFRELLDTSLAEWVAELAAYIESTGAEREKVLDAWRRLQAYRVLVPNTCDSLTADYFVSTVKLALEALRVAPPVVPVR